MTLDQEEKCQLKKGGDDLLNALEKDFLRELLNDFTAATGLTANIVTVSGQSIFSRKDAQNMCEFCKLVRNLERKRGLHRCTDAYERAGRQAAQYEEAYIFRCPAGLVEFVAPIMVSGIHVGSIICGQVLMWEPEDFFWVEIEQMNREITDDITPLVDAAKGLQVVSTDKVQAASKLLGVIANKIVGMVWEEAKRKKELEYQKSLLSRERPMREELGRKLNSNSSSYRHTQINGLIAAINDDDFDQAQSMFTVILADIINQSASFDHVYTEFYDLIFTLAHAAVDRGLDPEKCLQITMDYCNAGRFVTSLEGLGKIAQETFTQMVSCMSESTRPRKRAVDAMRGYIKTHLPVNFSLSDVAASVDLSPYYASRIFKEDQGMTVMEYATEMKLVEAKNLLSNPSFRIEEIAARVGYADASYFSRLFKKHTGMSPRQYRMYL